MGSIYRTGSSGGSIYRSGGHNYAGPSRGGGAPKKGGASVGGFFHNLYGDVKSSVLGAPGLVVHTAEAAAHDVAHNPWLLYAGPASFLPGEVGLGIAGRSQLSRDIAVPLAKQTAYTWSPLLAHGDIGGTARRLYEHPTAALDLAAGAGVAARALRAGGLLAEAPRIVTLRSPGAIAGEEGALTVTRPVVGGDLARRMKIEADQVLKRLPPEFRVLGRPVTNPLSEEQRFARAVGHKSEKYAAGLRLQARNYAPAERALNAKERVAANLIHDYPTRALLRDYKAHLSTLATPEADAQLRLLNDPKVIGYFEKPTKKMLAYLDESAGLGRQDAAILNLPENEQRVFLPALLARGARFEGDALVAPGRRTLTGMIDEIKAEAAAEGRPLPTYRPHRSVEAPGGTDGGTGGRGAQRYPVKQNLGILALTGRVAYDIDTMLPEFLRSVKYAVYSDRHADLLSSAVKVPTDEGLRPGNVYVRRSLAERIGYTEKTSNEFRQRLNELVPEPHAEENLSKALHDELTTNNEADALTDEQGFRYQIPERVANQITGEFTRSSKALRLVVDRPLEVWRALILNLRVGWLVNNIVGNTFLYLIKNAGPRGLRAYLQAVADTKGPAAVLRLISDKEIRNRLTPDDIAELLPEQVAGTFFGTQTPRLGRLGQTKVGKLATAAPRGFRSVDVAYEQALRRAMINRLVRSNPEFKRFYRKLPREARHFRDAAKTFLRENPQLVERVSKEVNDTLGDFFSLSRFERTALRGVAPFYAWYRAITLIAVKLPVDAPFRADVLLKLGQVGDEYTEDYGIPYLQGAVPVGDSILKTQGVNPLSTPFQTGEALAAGGRAFAGLRADPNAALNFTGMMNPFLAALFTSAIASSRGDTSPRGSGVYGIARGLPEWQLAQPFPPKLYEGSARQRAFLSYLGAPVVRVNRSEAQKRAKR